MASNIFIKRSSTASKRPTAASLEYGELALNYSAADGGLYYEDSSNNIIKVGPAAVGSSAPNSSPAGSSGNSVGEFWYDTTNSALKIWNGSAWSCTATGTVTSITAGSGLTGGTITTSGTIALDVSGVTAGTYSNSCVTVDCFGRVTSISSGCSPVLLCTVTAKGDLIAGTGSAAVTALPAGSDGQFLIACSCCASGLTYVTTVSGTVPDATTTVKGVVELATDAEVLDGVDTTRAVVPSSLQAKMSDAVNCTSSCVIASATAVKCAYDTAALALPKAGGTMTGDIVFNVGQTIPVTGIQNATTTQRGVVQLCSSVGSTCTNGYAASLTAVKCAYDVAIAALPLSGGSMNGDIIFSPTQTFPAIPNASTTQKGIVQIGDNIQVASGLISVNCASTGGPGVVQLCNDYTSTSCTFAATPNSVRCVYNIANAALPLAGGCMTGLICSRDIIVCPGNCITVGNCAITGVTSAINMASDTVVASATAVCTLNSCLNNYYLLKCNGVATGPITFCGGICFPDGSGVEGFSDSCLLTSSFIGATSRAVACAYVVAANALPRAGGTMSGNITFNTGQVFPVDGIQDSSTTQKGVVQLYDGVDSSSTSLALTANQGCILQSQIDALTVSSNLTLAGTIDGSTGLVASVTDAGTSKGFVVGQVLPNSTNTNKDYFVIVTVPGTMTPPEGSAQVTHQGDWWVSGGTGTGWLFLDVGFNANQATTTTAGIVCLATDAEVLEGTNSTDAVVPSALSSIISSSVSSDCANCIASSAAVKCAYDVAAAALPSTAFTAKGDILVGTSSSNYAALAVGPNNYMLVADSTSPAGVKWTPAGISSLAICYPLCNLGSSSAPTLCIIPATAPVGMTSGLYGVVSLSNCACSTSCDFAATSYAVNTVYQIASSALPKTGGTMTGNQTFGCDCNLCPTGITFANGVSTGSILGITDCYILTDCAIAASALAVNSVYNLALLKTGGTMTGAIVFNGVEVGNCSCITGTTTSLACTSTTTALAASAGCCLQTQVNDRLCLSGGTICGDIVMCAPGGGICFNVGGGCVTGISSALNGTSANVAASTAAVCCVYNSAILKSVVTAKGNLIAGTAASTVTALAVGTDGQVLAACAACAAGLTWVPAGAGTVTSITAGTGLSGGTITSSGTISLNTACVVQPTAYTAKGTILSASAASTPAALAVGGDGCYLVACSACTTGLMWGSPAVGAATPTACGLVFGCTVNLCHNSALGYNSGAALTASSACVTAIGKNALCLATGNGNTAVGAGAGSAITTGINNVVIGPNTAVANPVSSCQLAIGFSATCNWLTGDASKNIRPGAGILDCAGCAGTSGQLLTSTGTNLLWQTGAVGAWTSAGTIQSVGLGATTTAPTVGTTSRNSVSYRQIGPKEWEVVYALTATSTFTAGSGDYLFTLPNSLSFDTTLDWQPAYTGNVGTAAHINRLYFLPGPSSSQIVFTNGNTGSAYGAGPVIYDSTRFRFFATDATDPKPRAVGSSWYVGTASLLAFTIRFAFTAA